jgi:hypothetical protein
MLRALDAVEHHAGVGEGRLRFGRGAVRRAVAVYVELGEVGELPARAALVRREVGEGRRLV